MVESTGMRSGGIKRVYRPTLMSMDEEIVKALNVVY